MNIKEKVNEVKEYVDVKIKYIAATVKPETLVKVAGTAIISAFIANAKANKAKKELKEANEAHEELLNSYICIEADAMKESMKISPNSQHFYTPFTIKDALERDKVLSLVDRDGDKIRM